MSVKIMKFELLFNIEIITQLENTIDFWFDSRF